jgi:hypothetical protein
MRRWVGVFVVLIMLSSLGFGIQQAFVSQPPATIEQAIVITLHQAGAPSLAIQIRNAGCIPAPETCLSVIADVQVGGEGPVGRLACQEAWRDCTLTMQEFGLQAAPVPDVIPSHPWMGTIQHLVGQLTNWWKGMGYELS